MTNVVSIQVLGRDFHQPLDVHDVLVTIEEQLQDDEILGREDGYALAQQVDLTSPVGSGLLERDRVEEEVKAAATVREEQVAASLDRLERLGEVETDSMFGQGFEGCLGSVGRNEDIHVDIERASRFGMEAKGDRATDGVLDSCCGKALRHLNR